MKREPCKFCKTIYENEDYARNADPLCNAAHLVTGEDGKVMFYVPCKDDFYDSSFEVSHCPSCGRAFGNMQQIDIEQAKKFVKELNALQEKYGLRIVAEQYNMTDYDWNGYPYIVETEICLYVENEHDCMAIEDIEDLL